LRTELLWTESYQKADTTDDGFCEKLEDIKEITRKRKSKNIEVHEPNKDQEVNIDAPEG
jgi:hypothetical protein